MYFYKYILLMCIVLPSLLMTNVQAEPDCSAVTEIPRTECESLLDFYRSTDGDNWYFTPRWADNRPCSSWVGVGCKDGHVTVLSFPECCSVFLRGTLPDSINNLTKLTTLSLLNGLNGSIPDFNLPSLKHLILNAGFSGSIPNFSHLPALTTLDLSDNQLTGEIPNFSHLPALTTLDLSGNQLTSKTLGFSYLPALTTLNLAGNQLTGEIPDFSHLPALTTLSLSVNQLTGEIPDFSHLPALTTLSLSVNQLTGEIPDFSHLPALTVLHLRDNQLTGEIPDFAYLPALKQLYLDDNLLTGVMPDFVTFLGQEGIKFDIDLNCGLIAHNAEQKAFFNEYFMGWDTISPYCYELALTTIGTGTGDVWYTLTGNHRFDNKTYLHAKPNPGSIFMGWTTDNCTDSFILTEDTTCTAEFALTQCDVEGCLNTPRLINISTRTFVGQAKTEKMEKIESTIAGFILKGTGSKPILIRAMGQSLQELMIDTQLNPKISFHDMSKPTENTWILSNDDWQYASRSDEIPTQFQLTHSQDSALLLNLDTSPAGHAYTAVMESRSGDIGLMSIDAITTDSAQTSAVINLSTRAYVGTGQNNAIAGFIIQGEGRMKILIRGMGRSMVEQGIDTQLDPMMTLHDMQLPAGETAIHHNDNWSNDVNAAFIPATHQPSDATESAIFIELDASPEGHAYTAVLSPSDGIPGIGLVAVDVME